MLWCYVWHWEKQLTPDLTGEGPIIFKQYVSNNNKKPQLRSSENLLPADTASCGEGID